MARDQAIEEVTEVLNTNTHLLRRLEAGVRELYAHVARIEQALMTPQHRMNQWQGEREREIERNYRMAQTERTAFNPEMMTQLRDEYMGVAKEPEDKIVLKKESGWDEDGNRD